MPNPDGSVSLLRRLLQPQQQAGARHPGRAEQPDRAGRPRLRAADALPAAARLGRVHDHGAEGLRRQEADVDASSPTARRPRFRWASTIEYSGRAVSRTRRGQHAAGAEVLADGEDVPGTADRHRARMTGTVGQPVTLEADHRRHAQVKRARTRRSPDACRAPPVVAQAARPRRASPSARSSRRSTRSDGKTSTTATFSRAGRVHPSRAGQRQLGRGRRRVPVLLDQRLREGDGQVSALLPGQSPIDSDASGACLCGDTGAAACRAFKALSPSLTPVGSGHGSYRSVVRVFRVVSGRRPDMTVRRSRSLYVLTAVLSLGVFLLTMSWRRASRTCAARWSTRRAARCPACQIVITNQASGTFREVDQQRRRQLVRARPDAGRLPGVGGADRLQALPAARPAGDRRHHDDGAGHRSSWGRSRRRSR